MDRFDDMRARVSASSEETGGGGGVFAGFELNVKAETAIFKNDLVKCVKSEDYVGPKVYTHTLANTQTLFSRDYSVSASAFSNSGATITIRNEETGMYEPVTCTVSSEWASTTTFPTAYLSTLGDVLMGVNDSNQVFVVEIDKESRTADCYIITDNSIDVGQVCYWSYDGKTGYPLYDKTITTRANLIGVINKDFVGLSLMITGKYSNDAGTETATTIYVPAIYSFSRTGLSYRQKIRKESASTSNNCMGDASKFISDDEFMLNMYTGSGSSREFYKYRISGTDVTYIGSLIGSYGDRCSVLVFSHNFNYLVQGNYASSSDYSRSMGIYKINSDFSKTLIKTAYANYSNKYTSPSNVNITDDGRYISYDSKIFTLPDLVQVASGNLGGTPLDDDYRCISGTTMKALISGDSDYIASRFDGLITDATSENIYGIATKTLSIGENGTVAGLFRTSFSG